jgi:hypothetical protein
MLAGVHRHPDCFSKPYRSLVKFYGELCITAVAGLSAYSSVRRETSL